MNIETGEVKLEKDLSDEQRKSGQWVKLPDGIRWQVNPGWVKPRHLSKSDLKREKYMANVIEKEKKKLEELKKELANASGS